MIYLAFVVNFWKDRLMQEETNSIPFLGMPNGLIKIQFTH